MDTLVSTDWLADHSHDADLRIVDATYHVPLSGEPDRDAPAEFLAGHIPGALFMDLAGFADPDSPLPSTMPDAARFATRMERLGLGDGARIVLYDDAKHRTAARAWVMLRAFGVAAAILDGGLARWRAEGRPLEAGAVPARAAALSVADHAAGIRDMAGVRDAMGGAEQIVDARSAARFTGEEADPRADVAPGHIPGSRNLPYTKVFHPDGTWKHGDDLAAAFAEAGVDPARPIVATCGSGITASVIAVAAQLLGGEAAVYDGSWTEWGADPSTPKAIGPA